jgi:hypothetical protein
MNYNDINKFINLGAEKAMRHRKFNNDETDWYILLSGIRIRIQQGLRGRNRTRSATLKVTEL